MSAYKEFLCSLTGRLFIPKELSQSNEKKLLHISDTPVCFYPELKRLISVLKPSYIVHTGDLTDNIKLQIYPTSICAHEKWIKHLAHILESSEAEIILALGNHDDFDTVSRHFKRSLIIRDAETINIENISFRISHMPEGVKQTPARYNLFGHDLTLKSCSMEDKLYFNGVSNINIIWLESEKSTTLRYPAGTDDARLGRKKIGL